MQPIKILKPDHLDVLRAGIKDNLHRYEAESPWLDDVVPGPWHLESKIKMEDVELKMPDAHGLYDVENTEIIYTALETLTPSQAADERLWASLSHSQFWNYMRKRWPVEEKRNKENYIRERYFFMPNQSRALVRHGIARLWWYGYFSHDSSRTDAFELTKELLGKLDVAQSILERSVSNVHGLTKVVLESLHRRSQKGAPFDDREQFRTLMRHVNAVGGVTILDMLAEEELTRIVDDKINQIQSPLQEQPAQAVAT